MAETVTVRELIMALNNPMFIEIGEKPEPVNEPIVELPIEGYDEMNVDAAIAAINGLSVEDRAKIRVYEVAAKNRKTVLTAIDELDANVWQNKSVEELEVSDDIKLVLVGAELKTLGDIEKHTDENDGFKVDGLTEEMVKTIVAAMKPFIQ